MPHQKVREIFQKSTGVPIIKLKKINHFAFIHYETRDLAERVFQIMTCKYLFIKKKITDHCQSVIVGLKII